MIYHAQLVNDLAYPVQVNGTNNTVVATLDTGAQCSAIRLDVAKAAGLDWTRITNTGSIRGVSGEPLQVHRRTRLCLHAEDLPPLPMHMLSRESALK